MLRQEEANPIPMITRQKMMRPVMETATEGELNAWASVAKIMMINSSPYIFLRPTTSARYPKANCPMTVPPDVATLIAVSLLGGMVPALEECQKTIPNMAVTRLMAKMSSRVKLLGSTLMETKAYHRSL